MRLWHIVLVDSQINKLHLCKPLIRAIDSSNLKDEYTMAQRVTYKYYVGRKAMFDSDYNPGRAPSSALLRPLVDPDT